MKNTFYIASAFAALLAIGCNKSEQPAGTPETPAEESGIVLYAQDINAIGSKTTTTEKNGKFTVNWVNGDQLAVYTVPAGTDPTTMTLEEWQASEPVRFKATESAAEHGSMKFVLDETKPEGVKPEAFKSRLAAFKERYGAGNLDWYAVYPGIMETASHSGKGMVTFGISNKSQSGNNNMEHLAKQDVLFGKVLDTKEPVITMQHIGTLMEFAVTNASDTEFTVKSISITAPDVIVGEFRLNLTKETPLDKTDGFNQSGTYTLTVNDAEPIQRGETARFYQILTPFTVASGKSVSITVNTDKGFWSKTMTANSPINFIAGTKNTANLDVKPEQDVELKEHKDITMNFGNNVTGGGDLFLNLTDASLLTWTTGSKSQSKVDVAAFAGSGQKVPILASPLDAGMIQWIYPDIAKWGARNDTKFKKLTATSFGSISKLSELSQLYNSIAEDSAKTRAELAINNVIVVKLQSGTYALINIVSIAKNESDQPISAVLNIKTVK